MIETGAGYGHARAGNEDQGPRTVLRIREKCDAPRSPRTGTGRRTRATGTWQLVNRHCVLAAVRKRLDSRDIDEVLPTLRELGMEDYGFAAVMKEYRDAFDALAA